MFVFVSSRLYTQTHRRFKISEEKVKDHVQTLGLFQQPGVEALREPGDDPYDFKEGDIEYTFSTSKRLKSQGREPNKKAKVGRSASDSRAGKHKVNEWMWNFKWECFILQGEEITSNGALPDGKDAMSIFNSAPKSSEMRPSSSSSSPSPFM